MPDGLRHSRLVQAARQRTSSIGDNMTCSTTFRIAASWMPAGAAMLLLLASASKAQQPASNEPPQRTYNIEWCEALAGIKLADAAKAEEFVRHVGSLKALEVEADDDIVYVFRTTDPMQPRLWEPLYIPGQQPSWPSYYHESSESDPLRTSSLEQLQRTVTNPLWTDPADFPDIRDVRYPYILPTIPFNPDRNQLANQQIAFLKDYLKLRVDMQRYKARFIKIDSEEFYQSITIDPPGSTRPGLIAENGNRHVYNEQIWKQIGIHPDAAVQWRDPVLRKVALLDTGVFDHPEFKRHDTGAPPDAQQATVLRQYDPTKAMKDPACVGESCCDSMANNHGTSHGTKVAGIIAADANDNDRGTRGITNVDELMSFRIPDIRGSCLRKSRLVAAMRCAIQRNADVINVSMESPRGRPEPTDLLQAMHAAPSAGLTTAPASRRPLIVVAAGNGTCDLSKSCKVWPAALAMDWMITVEALDIKGQRLPNSNYGGPVVLGAPAPDTGSLCTTSNEMPVAGNDTQCSNGYGTFSQTSAATALVSGAAALVWGHPNFRHCSAEQLRDVLVGYGEKVAQTIRDHGRPQTSCRLNVSFLYKPIAGGANAPEDLCQKLPAEIGCEDLRVNPL
jgi:hypothetical protein